MAAGNSGNGDAGGSADWLRAHEALNDVNYSCSRTTTILAEEGQVGWSATATVGRSELRRVGERSRNHG
jgi:hypothetical protein